MHLSEKSKNIREPLKRQVQKGAGIAYGGVSRRATSFLPTPMAASDILLKGASINQCSSLLLSLELNQQSACILIQSEKNKSRSGILIFRGRILGCVHGQKNMGKYLFGNQAYERALRDLQNTNNTIVDIYGLKEEVAVAAGALFHGPLSEMPQVPAPKFFQEALTQLINSKMPGCVIIADGKDISAYMVYFFGGEILGIHSSKKGWLKSDILLIQEYLNNNKDQRVQFCIMPIHKLEEVGQYSFRPYRLIGKETATASQTGNHPVMNIFHSLHQNEARLRSSPVEAFLKAVLR